MLRHVTSPKYLLILPFVSFQAKALRKKRLKCLVWKQPQCNFLFHIQGILFGHIHHFVLLKQVKLHLGSFFLCFLYSKFHLLRPNHDRLGGSESGHLDCQKSFWNLANNLWCFKDGLHLVHGSSNLAYSFCICSHGPTTNLYI